MAHLTKTKVTYIATAILLWMGLAFSMGWYHYLTSLGQDGWPLPTPEAAATFLAYRESAGVLQAGDQSIYWFLVVPLAGTLWVGVQFLTAPFFGQHGQLFPETVRRYAFAGLPLVVLGLVAAAASWKYEWGVWWARGAWGPWDSGFGRPWPWLLWAYEACAAGTLVAQFVVYFRVFHTRGAKLVWHLVVSLGLLLVVSVGVGTALRELLERLLP